MLFNVRAPEFINDPHFYIDDDGFHLRDGAPQEVIEEFEEFMEQQSKAEEDGVCI